MIKKLKTTGIVSSILLGIGLFPSVASAATTCQPGVSGSGTASDPCIIKDINQLQAINSKLTLSYALGNDIDASATKTWNKGAGFSPIANFSGTLDGKNYKIKNLYVNRPSSNKVGLFSSVSNANVRNVTIENAEVYGNTYSGISVGAAYNSTLTNVHTSGTIKGVISTGGLVGLAQNATVDQSSSSASVSSSNVLAGGLIARVMNDNKTISNSYATGSVQAAAFAGGLLGDVSNNSQASAKAYVKNSYATGNVKATSSTKTITNYYAGGLIGLAENAVITDVSAKGKVEATSFAGGLIAFLQKSTLDKGVSSGNVNVAGNLAGGLLANSAGNNKISNSTSTGNVVATGPNSYWVGGFAGRTVTGTEIYNSSATGNVSSASYDVGGFTGYSIGTKIVNSSASGVVTSTSTKNIGKFMGSANGKVTVENSFAKGSSSAGNKFVGATFGTNNVFTNSF